MMRLPSRFGWGPFRATNSFADSVDQLTIKGVASTSFTLALLDA